MLRNHGHLACSTLALVLAAGLGAPAFAADTTVTIAEGTTQTTAVTASPAAGDTYTLNILGTLRPSNANNVTNVTVQGSGAGAVVIVNDGRLQGRLNFSAATGPVTLRNNTGPDAGAQAWHTGGITLLGSGDDLIENTDAGVIATTNATTFDFGGGDDALVNTGRLIIDRTNNMFGVSSLTLLGLETFENSGVILLGSAFNDSSRRGVTTDMAINDVLIAQGVAFTGSGGSRIAMDVLFDDVTQSGCSSLTAADCVDFSGGSTAGSTLLTVREAISSTQGALNEGITLIVGSSAAEHFSLDPASDNFVAQSSLGAVLQKRLVAYDLVYDAEGQRHMLVGLPADEVFQSATFAASAQETWRSTAGIGLTRQADLRATPGGLTSSNGLWARIGAGQAEREGEASFTQGASTYGYSLDHKQKTAHLVFGADMVGAARQDAFWVVGGMLGFVRADVEYDATPTEVIYSGATGGLYASWVGGPLFVDGLLNLNVLDMEGDMPNMNLGPEVKLTQTIKSLGGQLEAGWRLSVGEGLFVEPLAGVSYVETQFEDIDVPGGGGSFDFEDSYTSFRAGAGVRVGMDSELMGLTAVWSLTGRYWNEFEGENATTVLITNGATEIPLMDDFSGGFSELAGSVNLYTADGLVSAFVNLGGKFADDYSAVDGALGVRLRW